MPPFMIAVHAGAGYHSPENEDGYKRRKFKFQLFCFNRHAYFTLTQL